MLHSPFYDPAKSYEENFEQGPFGDFADGKVFQNLKDPEYDFFGQKVYLPFGIPPGPLANAKFIKAALDKGFDVVIHKTVRSRAKKTNSWPNIMAVNIEGDLTLAKAQAKFIVTHNYKEPLSIINSFGNPSADPDVWQKDLSDSVAYAKTGQAIIGSFEGTIWSGTSFEDSIKDWVLAAKLVKETGVHALEANISCPNEGVTDLLCFDIPRVKIIVEAIKNEVGNSPLIIKLAYFENHEQLQKLVKTIGNTVDGVAVIEQN